MFENIKKEMTRQEYIDGLKKAKDSYKADLGRLEDMKKLLFSLDKKSSILQKIDIAIALNKDCIHRTEIIIDSLQNRDFKYFDKQKAILLDKAEACGRLANEINNEIKMFCNSVRI